MTNKVTKTYANGRCYVFQPFDKADFDKRFDDVLTPAIEAVGLEPYRVDRDSGAVIPVDTLHKEIQSATICVADITTRNPNVMYELGYAIAAGKDVAIISGPNAEKFPFDIQHRGIISYSTGSPSDFIELQQKLTAKLEATLERLKKTTSISAASPVKESAGLKPHEQTALALLFANCDSTDDEVWASSFKEEMRKAGYTDVGARLAIAQLCKLGYAKYAVREGNNDERWVSYAITEEGETWLTENQGKLELRVRPRPAIASYEAEISDDDIPF